MKKISKEKVKTFEKMIKGYNTKIIEYYEKYKIYDVKFYMNNLEDIVDSVGFDFKNDTLELIGETNSIIISILKTFIEIESIGEFLVHKKSYINKYYNYLNLEKSEYEKFVNFAHEMLRENIELAIDFDGVYLDRRELDIRDHEMKTNILLCCLYLNTIYSNLIGNENFNYHKSFHGVVNLMKKFGGDIHEYVKVIDVICPYICSSIIWITLFSCYSKETGEFKVKKRYELLKLSLEKDTV